MGEFESELSNDFKSFDNWEFYKDHVFEANVLTKSNKTFDEESLSNKETTCNVCE